MTDPSASSATDVPITRIDQSAEMPAMNVVIIGHVDHGKSTVVGRLLHDTGVLPHGRIEQVRRNCKQAGKPFEYAFLLDALRDEQAQGITIDAARVFFRSERRHYIIIDAPGHIEFLKNMISGAARAEAAVLVIDAHEGVRENSRRHGFMASMLGIGQLLVAVNKMDLVGYDQAVFTAICEEYTAFLDDIQVTPCGFIPVSGRHGDNLVTASPRTQWYDGVPLLERMDAFESAGAAVEQALRMPVQDVYKFPAKGDDARIIAGTLAAGRVAVGDEVEFLPSSKRSHVRSIEGFNVPPTYDAAVGEAIGITLTEELYVRPGEVMCRVGEVTSHVGTTFRTKLFWMSPDLLRPGRRYLLKLATARVPVHVKEIVQVLDSVTLERTAAKEYVSCHEVAECVLEAHRPIAFDLGVNADQAATGRFVLVDQYEIAGGGIITEYLSNLNESLIEHIKRRDYSWIHGAITVEERVNRNGQTPCMVVISGSEQPLIMGVARRVEKDLFHGGRNAYYFGLSNLSSGLDDAYSPRTEQSPSSETRVDNIRQLGEISHFLTDAGQIVITVVADLDVYEADMLRILNQPKDLLIVRIGSDIHGVEADLVLPVGVELAEGGAAVCRMLGLEG